MGRVFAFSANSGFDLDWIRSCFPRDVHWGPRPRYPRPHLHGGMDQVVGKCLKCGIDGEVYSDYPVAVCPTYMASWPSHPLTQQTTQNQRVLRHLKENMI